MFTYLYPLYNLQIKQVEPLVEFMSLVFTRMPGESYRRQLRSLFFYITVIKMPQVSSSTISALSHLLTDLCLP